MLITSQCNAIHKTIVEQFKHAIVYGQSVKHQPQRVGLSHELADEDISKCEKGPPVCPVLTVGSHDHKAMIVVNESIGRWSSQSRRTAPRSSHGPHHQINESRGHESKMSVAKARLTVRRGDILVKWFLQSMMTQI